MTDDSGKYVPFAYAKWGVQGTMDQGGLAAGTNSSKIAILDGENTMTAWTLGNPSDWEQRPSVVLMSAEFGEINTAASITAPENAQPITPDALGATGVLGFLFPLR